MDEMYAQIKASNKTKDLSHKLVMNSKRLTALQVEVQQTFDCRLTKFNFR